MFKVELYGRQTSDHAFELDIGGRQGISSKFSIHEDDVIGRIFSECHWKPLSSRGQTGFALGKQEHSIGSFDYEAFDNVINKDDPGMPIRVIKFGFWRWRGLKGVQERYTLLKHFFIINVVELGPFEPSKKFRWSNLLEASGDWEGDAVPSLGHCLGQKANLPAVPRGTVLFFGRCRIAIVSKGHCMMV